MENQQSIAPNGSRREFLKTSAAAMAGLGITNAMATPVHAAGDDTLKIALIGCGSRGTGAAVQALNTSGSVKLWALADTFDDRLQSCLKHIQRELTNGRDLNKKDRSAIDVSKARRFVGLDAYRKAIDSGVGCRAARRAARLSSATFRICREAGKHVFMEKPVATDPAGIRRVLAAAEEAKKKNLKVGVGLQRHHQPLYQEAIKRIGRWRDRRHHRSPLLLERRLVVKIALIRAAT